MDRHHCQIIKIKLENWKKPRQPKFFQLEKVPEFYQSIIVNVVFKLSWAKTFEKVIILSRTLSVNSNAAERLKRCRFRGFTKPSVFFTEGLYFIILLLWNWVYIDIFSRFTNMVPRWRFSRLKNNKETVKFYMLL